MGHDEPDEVLIPLLRPAWQDSGWTIPVPHAELIWRVAGSEDVSHFVRSGRQSVVDIARALAIRGERLESQRRILDFGCGCGRILLWLEALGQRADLYGVDIDGEAIEWAREHVPYASLLRNEGSPPLDFPAGFFDLIYNHSVFTHLDAAYQDDWLAELARITRPGGFVLLTVNGEYAFAEFERTWRDAGADPSAHRETLRDEGLLYIADDSWVGGPFPDFYHSTFHAPWYVFAHWSSFFDICAYITRGALGHQDQVLLQAR